MKLSGSKRSIIALVAGVAIGLMFLGTAAAVRSGKFVYNSPKTGFISLSPSDFTPDGPSSGYFNSWGADSLSSDGSTCFNAGVNLPHKAVIKWVDFYYESGPTTDFYGEFLRQDFLAGAGESLGVVNPLDDSGVPTIASVAITPPLGKVNNSVFAYMVGVCPGSDSVLHGIRIEYTYKTAGD